MLAPVRAAKVLLVEDDPLLRDLYRSALIASRYKVSAAGDGLAALTMVELDRPDVVVLDLALPRVSGWDVYRDLRATPATSLLPIIIVSGNDLRDIRREDLSSFLEKPVDPNELVGAVDRALAGV